MNARLLLSAAGACILIAANAAMGQTPGADPNVAAPFGNPVEDQSIFLHVLVEQFEGRFGEERGFVWDGQAWAGTDLDRVWFKSEARTRNGNVEDGIHEALYSRAISTYFDLQAGLRYDLDSRPSRGWAAFGIQGLAPGFFNIEATAYASDAGHLAARFRGSYDLLITQRLIFQPEFELNLYSKSEPRRGVGSGPSDFELGLRLRYEVTRKFAPYIGVEFENKFGNAANLARREDETVDDVRFVVGVRFWY